jgi:hypothetical protein
MSRHRDYIARVFWDDVPGRPGRFIMVEAHTPSDMATAIIVLVQGMTTLEGFTPEVKAAANALLAALRAGDHQLPPTLVVNVVERGGRPKS